MFRSYRQLSNKEKEELCRECVFVIDTNVLLDLHRINHDLAVKILSTLFVYRDQGRLAIPEHVSEEYAKHAESIQMQSSSLLQELVPILQSHCSSFEEKLPPLQNYISLSSSDEIIALLNQCLDKINNSLQAENDKYTGLIDDKTFIDEVMGLIGSCVMDKVADDKKKYLEYEANRRYKNNIPPGGCDAGKSENMAGDFIIWHEILNFANQKHKSVILVTGDLKPDWMAKVRGKHIGPRRELREEFHKSYPEGDFYIYPLHKFLTYCGVGSVSFSEEELKIIENRKCYRNQLQELVSVKQLDSDPTVKNVVESDRGAESDALKS